MAGATGTEYSFGSSIIQEQCRRQQHSGTQHQEQPSRLQQQDVEFSGLMNGSGNLGMGVAPKTKELNLEPATHWGLQFLLVTQVRQLNSRCCVVNSDASTSTTFLS